DLGRKLFARFVEARGAVENAPGHDQRLGLRSGIGEASGDEKFVEALFFGGDGHEERERRTTKKLVRTRAMTERTITRRFHRSRGGVGAPRRRASRRLRRLSRPLNHAWMSAPTVRASSRPRITSKMKTPSSTRGGVVSEFAEGFEEGAGDDHVA